ncbi:hypothetical protein QR680_000488 [Steinernema hermaphroditum]|uniref:Uncharacterized protein n=1 Tax=Steinernema hermaphroditum TaxID=289476 RepID=A0AA39GUS4_9BILA|nr:hypothetical protein QR680_000488 [Steinernema hermaphroditum]
MAPLSFVILAASFSAVIYAQGLPQSALLSLEELEMELEDICLEKALHGIARKNRDPSDPDLQKLKVEATVRCRQRRFHLRQFAKGMCCPNTPHCDLNCATRAAERMIADFMEDIIY